MRSANLKVEMSRDLSLLERRKGYHSTRLDEPNPMRKNTFVF